MFNPWIYFRKSAAFKTWCAIFLAISAAYFVMGKLNGRDQMADFRVYHDAAQCWSSNEPMYGQSFGVSSGFYKYSPIASVPFLPFTLVEYPVSSAMYYILISLLFLVFTAVLLNYQEYLLHLPRARAWLLVIFSLFIADHVERELHLGNVNVLLMLFAVFLFISFDKGNKILSGLFLAVVLLYKPHFLILFVWFAWKNEWKILLSCVLFVLAGIFLPAIWTGWSHNLELLGQWFHAVQDHNVHLYESPNTIYGMINSLVLSHIGLKAGFYFVFVMLALIAFSFLFWIRWKKVSSKQFEYLQYFVLIALIPNLVHTDTEHFMWSFPLIAYVWGTMLNYNVSNKLFIILMMCLAFVPYTINSPDIVGRELSKMMDEGGLLGLANLLIISSAILTHQFVHSKRTIEAQPAVS